MGKLIGDVSRREFCQTLALGAAFGLTTTGFANPRDSRGPRTLLRGGTVISVDRAVGDFDRADVLIEGSRIAAVGRNLPAGDAHVIPADNMIVMPGFIDTHRHLWQGQLRNTSPSGSEYLEYRNKCGPVYRPEDAYIGDLVSFYARTLRVGKSSITVHVEVEAERFGSQGKKVKVTEAEVTFVAINESRQKVQIGA